MTTSPSNLTVDDLLGEAGWLRGIARALAAPSAGVDADDLSQDVLLQALRTARVAVVHGGTRPWLAGIARHLASNLRRGSVRRQGREHAVARPEHDGGDPTADVVARAEIQRCIANAVMALPGEQRDCVLLRWWDSLPPRAIAARLGVPVETVRTRIKRALARLREVLDAEHGERRAWLGALVPVLGLDAGAFAEARALVDAPAPATPALAGAALLAVLVAAGAVLLWWLPDGGALPPPALPGVARTEAAPPAAAVSGAERVPAPPVERDASPLQVGQDLLARIDAAWEIEDHWRLANAFARDATAEALVAAIVRANDEPPKEPAARPLRRHGDSRSARLATLCAALARQVGSADAASRLVAAWPERPRGELLRFVGRHASASQLSAFVATHGRVVLPALLFTDAAVLREVVVPDGLVGSLEARTPLACVAIAIARGDAEAIALLERKPPSPLSADDAVLLALAERVRPYAAASPQSARFWFAAPSEERLAAARAASRDALPAALGALPIAVRLRWATLLLAGPVEAVPGNERALLRGLAEVIVNVGRDRFAEPPTAGRLEIAPQDATWPGPAPDAAAQGWRSALARTAMWLSRSVTGTERSEMQRGVEAAFAELGALGVRDPDRALAQALLHTLLWLDQPEPVRQAAAVQALAAQGALHGNADWNCVLLERVAALDPRTQSAWTPVYWQLAAPEAHPEVRRRALVLALTFEPDAARVQRVLDEARARGDDHEAIARALPLRWRHGNGELSAAIDWFAAMLATGTVAQLHQTFDGFEDGFEQALDDGAGAGEAAAAVLARVPRPEDVPRLDERGKRELAHLRQDLEERVARRARGLRRPAGSEGR